MAIVGRALDAMPAAHRNLWAKGRLIVRLAASRYYVRGHAMNEVLAVIADPGTLLSTVTRRFFEVHVVQVGGGDEPLIAILVGAAATRLLSNFPDTAALVTTIPTTSFLLVTSPVGCCPGASLVNVLQRRKLD